MPKEPLEFVPIDLTETMFSRKFRGEKEKKPLIGEFTDYEEKPDEDKVILGFEVNGPAGRRIVQDAYYLCYLFVASEGLRKSPTLFFSSLFINIALNQITLAVTHEFSHTKRFGDLLKDMVRNKEFKDGGIKVKTGIGQTMRFWHAVGDEKAKELDPVRPKGIKGVFTICLSDLEASLANEPLNVNGVPITTKRDLAVFLATNLLLQAGKKFDLIQKGRGK